MIYLIESNITIHFYNGMFNNFKSENIFVYRMGKYSQ